MGGGTREQCGVFYNPSIGLADEVGRRKRAAGGDGGGGVGGWAREAGKGGGRWKQALKTYGRVGGAGLEKGELRVFWTPAYA